MGSFSRPLAVYATGIHNTCFPKERESALPCAKNDHSDRNLAKKIDKNTGKAVNYEYDSLGRLIRSYQSNGSSVVQRTEHIYDTSNRINSQSWQLGDTTYGETYTYDTDDGALTCIEGSGGVPSISFGYDALKRLSYRYNYYFRQDYTYRDISSGSKTTTQVASIAYSQRPGGTNFSTFRCLGSCSIFKSGRDCRIGETINIHS